MAAYVKANNTTNLNIASSWTANSGFPSSTADTATWNSTVTGANTVSLGGAITAGTITIANPGGLVTLNAATTTTLTVGSGGFDLSSATQNLDINGPIQIVLAANQPWSVASGRRLATGTEISGAYVITKNGTGLLQLNNSGTFSGITLNAGSVWVVASGAGLTTPIGARTSTTAVTIANGGKLEFQANDVIATAVNINETNLPQITLNGNADNGTYLFATRYNGVGNVTLNSAWLVQASTDGGSFRGWQFIGTITSTGTSRISSNNSTPNHLNGIAPTTFNVTSGTLTIEASAPLIDASPAQAGAGALTKSGAGTLTVAAANTFTGAVSVSAGTLNANSATALGAASSTAGISVSSGATLSLGGASNITYTAPRTLTLAGTGVSGTTGALVINNAVTNTFSGIALTAGTLIRASESGTLTAPVTTNNHNLTFTVAASKTLTLPSTSVISASTSTVSYNTVSGDTGTAVVSAQNLYTNPTVINQGTVRVGASYIGSPGSVTSGPLGRGQLTWNGGALDASTTATLGNNVVLGGDVSFGGTAALTLAGTVSLGASRTITTNGSGGALTLSGVVSGTGFKLTKAGTNTLVLSNGSNSYSGGTDILSGTLSFANGALGTTGNIVINGGTLQWATGNTQDLTAATRIVLQNSGSATFDTNGNNVNFSNEFAGGSSSSSLTKIGSGILSLQGSAAFLWTGSTTVSAGTLAVAGSTVVFGSGPTSIAAGAQFSFTTTTGFTMSGGIANNGTLSFATSASHTLTGVISGSGSLLKSGTGTLTLSSSTASSYTGPVTISEGRLDANLLSPLGSNASTQPITVSSGATLSLGAVGNTANSRVLYLAGTGVTATTGALILNTTSTVSLSRFDLTGATLIRATASGVVNNGITSNNNDLTISVASGTSLRMTSVAVIGASTTSVSYHTVSGDTGTVLVQAKHLYTGTTTINQGTISVNTGSLGSPGSITSGPFGRGQINWNGGAFATEVGQTPTVGNDIVVGGDVSFKGPEVLTLSGPVLLSASRTITTDGTGNQLEISGTISGAGSKLTKAGSRTIRLTAANTYDGGTDIVAGVVETGNTQALGTAGTVTLRAGARLRTRIAGGVNGKLTVAALDNSEGGVIQIGSF